MKGIVMRPLKAAYTGSVLCALLISPAAAQIGNPAGNDPATKEQAPGVPAPDQTNVQDRLFAQLLATGGIAEVNAGKLATAKALTGAIRDFGKRMVDDHGKANAKLADLAKQAGISLPQEADGDHKAMQDRLEKASKGNQFDGDYMRGQLLDHQKTVQLLEWEIGQG